MMTTPPMIETELLHAFVDGELDLLASRELQSRIDVDAALRARVDAVRHLRRNVAEAADYHPAPGSLRSRVLAIDAIEGLPDSRPTLRPQPHRRPTPQPGPFAHWLRWPDWRPLGASFALVAVASVALNMVRERSGADDRLAQEVVASHVRATLGEHLVDVASSDHHTVKPWLSSRLDFSPPVPDTPLPGSPFVGGRVDYLDGHPVAALVFRHGNHVVNSFVWPTDGADRAVVTTAERGFQIAHWTRGRMTHWTISDVNREEFDGIVRKLAAAE